jgi:protein subunit release factor B
MDDTPSQPQPQQAAPSRPVPPGGTEPPPYSTDRAELERLCTLEPTRGSGPGGQRRNKVETGVRLVHPPSGVAIVATRRASRLANVEDAFERLALRLEKLNHVPKRRRPTRPSKAAKEARLETKKRLSRKKSDRRYQED